MATSEVLSDRLRRGGIESASLPGDRRFAWLAAMFVAPLIAAAWGIILRDAAFGSASFAGLAMATLCVVWTDLRWRRIYNWTTYSLAFWSFAINALVTVRGGRLWPGLEEVFVAPPAGPAWLGGIGFLPSLVGGIVCFHAVFLVFALLGTGAGDVKFAGAIGFVMGAYEGVVALLFASVAAGVAVLVYSMFKFGPVRAIGMHAKGIGGRLLPNRFVPDARERELSQMPIPMGPFFAVGISLTLAGADRWLAAFGSP